jgi:hypothetical protein
MADLQSMTLQERMNTINNAKYSRTDNINDTTFQEACNRYLKLHSGNLNGVDYSGIGLNDYTPEEAFSIMLHEDDSHSKDLTELINHMGPYDLHTYTATEALNKADAITEG